MNDGWHKFTNWMDHNRGILVSIIITASTAAWLTACESVTASPTGSGVQVDWIQLGAEVDTFAARVTAAEADLRAQDALKSKFVEISSGLATSILQGTFNPTQLITSLVTIAGVTGSAGLAFDNRRKNKVIKALKTGGESA
jgi:hypothetical protein